MFFYGHTHLSTLGECDGTNTPTSAEIAAPAKFDLSTGKRYLCNPGPLTDRKDIDIEVPNRKNAIVRTPSFVIFDTETRELRYEIAMSD